MFSCLNFFAGNLCQKPKKQNRKNKELDLKSLKVQDLQHCFVVSVAERAQVEKGEDSHLRNIKPKRGQEHQC